MLVAVHPGAKRQYRVRGLPFVFDFFVPDLALIVDFHGDYWHANPSLYEHDSVIRHVKGKQVMALDLWSRDATRRREVLRRGLRYAVLWESDFRIGGQRALWTVIQEAQL